MTGEFFHAYLEGFHLILSFSLGGLALLMLYHMVGGRWGYVVRRPAEAAARTLPVVAAAFIPVLLGRKTLFPWARPEEVAADPLLRAKVAYLNTGSFTIRAAVYFAIWIGLAFTLSRWSREQDAGDGPAVARKMQAISAPGLIIYGATTLFASVDWLMSLTPKWYSSIFGMSFMVGQALTAMAMLVLTVFFVSRRRSFGEYLEPGLFRDLGNLLFMFIMLWAYMTFSQLIIIWSGNLPEEITFYMSRLKTTWEFVSLGILLFYFAVPFLLLLSRQFKGNLSRIAGVAGLILFMRWVDIVWLIRPTFHPDGVSIGWLDVAVPAALVGLWLGFYRRELNRYPILASNDPRVQGVSAHD